ncbi:MAG: hypothetical protein CL536_01480 [Alcaligenaceae bacterium]|jgi:DNA-binding CsgD family transcriptional regulator|nr:hypothetical protein [Alcaligenaceae bacterium]
MAALRSVDTSSSFTHNVNCVERLALRSPRGRRSSLPSVNRTSDINNQPWGGLIDSIGSGDFFNQLRAWLKLSCQVDHIGLFQLHESSISVIACISPEGSGLATERIGRYTSSGLWRFDPSIHHIRQGLKTQGQQHVRVNLDGLSKVFRETLYRGLGDKVVLSGVRNSGAYSLSLFRDDSQNRFAREDIESLMHLSEPLISAVAKHCELRNCQAHRALRAPIAEIYACIQTEHRLTSRELEVCARIIYGMSHLGIALDLNVGEETVKTYKNRAYQKLGIGSQRELLMWYLSLWNPFDH